MVGIGFSRCAKVDGKQSYHDAFVNVPDVRQRPDFVALQKPIKFAVIIDNAVCKGWRILSDVVFIPVKKFFGGDKDGPAAVAHDNNQALSPDRGAKNQSKFKVGDTVRYDDDDGQYQVIEVTELVGMDCFFTIRNDDGIMHDYVLVENLTTWK